MRAHIRGTGASGDPIDAYRDLPDTIRVGDSLMVDTEGDKRVAIVGMRKAIGRDGRQFTTVVVTPAFVRPSQG